MIFASDYTRQQQLSLQIADAVAIWQQESDRYEVAQSLWVTAKQSGTENERTLWRDCKSTEKIRDGALEQVARLGRRYLEQFQVDEFSNSNPWTNSESKIRS